VHGRKSHIRNRSLRERGQALLEFAFIVPIFLILLLGIIDFGWALKSWITVTNATREGARMGAVGWALGEYLTDCNDSDADDLTVVGRTCSALAASVDDVQDVTATCEERNGVPDCQTGDSVVVSMSYGYDFITPLGSFIAGFTKQDCDGVETDLCIRSTADMRME
jgi:Flp pilus assembly protein TadG